MRALPSALQQHLDSGATTLCWCWRIVRRDGRQLGFTDHDRDILFDSTVFEAAAGLTASEIKDTVGLSVDELEVQSALSSDRLSEAELAAGLYDDARVEVFRVNWIDPAQRVLLRTGSIGEVKRSSVGFTAEIRGLAHYLQQPSGRLLQFTCDADLGDARCQVPLSDPAFVGQGAVSEVIGDHRFLVSGLDAFADHWFERGALVWTSGANSGVRHELKEHDVGTQTISLGLWTPPPQDITPGDAFVVTAGCDKTLATCREKFANAINFRGFPHMPGTDFVTSYARPGSLPRRGTSAVENV